jgi:AraC family transcriptional activator FtrA
MAPPLTVADLARHANASERTLTRRFAADTGQSPLQ